MKRCYRASIPTVTYTVNILTIVYYFEREELNLHLVILLFAVQLRYESKNKAVRAIFNFHNVVSEQLKLLVIFIGTDIEQ